MNPSKKPQKNSELLPNAPFDDTCSGFILRSSDGENFRVFKAILSLPSLKNQKKLDLARRHLYRRDPLQEASWAMRTPSLNLHANTKLMRLGPSFYALSRTPSRMTPLAFMPLQLHMDTRILGQRLQERP
jgi:hypothetical protein